MATATPYIEIDNETVAVDSNHITIEGADQLVGRLKKRATRMEDYLGIGNPLIYK